MLSSHLALLFRQVGRNADFFNYAINVTLMEGSSQTQDGRIGRDSLHRSVEFDAILFRGTSTI